MDKKMSEYQIKQKNAWSCHKKNNKNMKYFKQNNKK